jgi:hypothetical protein
MIQGYAAAENAVSTTYTEWLAAKILFGNGEESVLRLWSARRLAQLP